VPQLPARWAIQVDEEKAAIFVQSQLHAYDLIVTALHDNTPLWYYFIVYGVKEAQFVPSKPFTRALVLAELEPGETLASVVTNRTPYQIVLNWDSCSVLRSFGQIQVFSCLQMQK
jgi:hypothetical protein